MENEKKNEVSSADISASDLLAKLKANIAQNPVSADGGKNSASVYNNSYSEEQKQKKYRFRHSTRINSAVTEEDIRNEMPQEDRDAFKSPVPRSEIEDLDIESLMRKYLPAEEYEQLSKEKPAEASPVDEDDEFVITLSNLNAVKNAGSAPGYGEIIDDKGVIPVSFDTESYTPPDADLFDDLSADGKVCDIPEMKSTRNFDARAAADGDTLNFINESTRVIGEQDEIFVPEPEQTAVFAAETDNRSDDGDPDDAYRFEAADTDTKIMPSPSEITALFEAASVGGKGALLPAEIHAAGKASLANENIKTAEIAAVRKTEHGADEEIADEEIAGEELTEEDLRPVYGDAARITHTADIIGDENPEDPDFDVIDANLMIAFGMDEELDKALGKENADKLRADIDNAPDPAEQVAAAAEETDDEDALINEFSSFAQTREIMSSYSLEYGKSALRLFGVAAIALILFFYENISLLGGKLVTVFNPEIYPVVNIMVGLQVLLLGFAVVYKQVIKGAKSLIARKPVPESFLPVLLAVSVIFSVAACFFTPGAPFHLFNFPVSLCLLLTVINERLDLRREIFSFNIVSSKRTKYALEKLDVGEDELEKKAFDEFLPNQPSIFRINKTSFIDGYYRRTKEYPSIKSVLGAFVPASALITAIAFIAGFVVFKSATDAFITAYMAIMFCAPAAMFITFGLPCFRASKKAFEDKSAFVGESALDEYTTAASISFDDRDVFPTNGVKLKSVKVFGTGRIDYVIYNVASIYSVLGGPLSDVLNVATADFGHSDDVDIRSIENDGVEAVVDDKHVFMGKDNYLRKKGYLPVSDPDDEEIEGGGEISIMYLATGDEVVAKLYLRYRIDPDFETTLKTLYKSGICVGIKTVDPNINDEMLSTKIKLVKYPVRVLKYANIEDSIHGNDATDSGIVSKKSSKALLRTFTLCDKVQHVTKMNIVINLFTMIFGLIITACIVAFGTPSSVYSLYAALYQAFWIVPIYLMSKLMIS